MRVVVVHNRYRSSNPSGENRVVESDIEQLRADSVEVIPYIRDSDEIEQFSAIGKMGLAVRPLVSPVDALAFRRLLRGVQPDIVHLHNPFPLISPWIVRTAKAQRVPVVQTVHNYRHVCVNGIHFREGAMCTECVGKKAPWPAVQHGCYQGSRARSVPMAAALMAHRGTWDLVDRFLPVGDAVADHLRTFGVEDERIEVRPNVVDDPGEPTEMGRGALFVGRLSPEKGVKLLIDAWRKSGLGALGQTLAIAGDGELRHEVVAAAESDDSIRYLGLIEKDALGNAYRDCALVVVPSLWSEADGIAAATGNAHGRAVLATDAGALPLSVAKGSGWLVGPSVEKLATGLSAAFDSREELARRGTAGRSQYLKKRLPHRRESLRSVYQRILSSRRCQQSQAAQAGQL
jgi:glycosyltransferase involved in cell wall biosynthesis